MVVLRSQVLIIEVNTVPGLTPSTVLIHQALSEQPPLYPQQFFRTLLDLASERSIQSCLLPRTLTVCHYSHVPPLVLNNINKYE
uniref:ATP-grasp domain-containing protein n=1 Tax=Solanum lycopersicum TaxID=4081 RepID=A0A494G8M6_SOLLC